MTTNYADTVTNGSAFSTSITTQAPLMDSKTDVPTVQKEAVTQQTNYVGGEDNLKLKPTRGVQLRRILLRAYWTLTSGTT